MPGRAVTPIPKAKRGKGHLEGYMPGLQACDVNSHGATQRTLSWTTNREVHTFSSHETRFLYCCDWSPFVVDINEQIPLPISTTKAICKELGIRHPESAGELVEFHTDFVLKIKKGDVTTELARSIKPAAELEKDAILELLEVERHFHQSRDRDWGIVTELDIPTVLADNLKRIHSYYFPDHIAPLSQSIVDQVQAYLLKAFAAKPRPIFQVASRCDTHFKLETGNSLTIFYHLIANRRVPANMMLPLDPSAPLNLLPTHLRSVQ